MGDKTYGKNSPILKGFFNFFRSENPIYLKLYPEVENKLKSFVDFFKYTKGLIERKYSNDIILKYLKITKLKFNDLLHSIKKYEVAIIDANIIHELNNFYSEDIFEVLKLGIQFNDLIRTYNLNCKLISSKHLNYNLPQKYKEHFTNLLKDL